MPRPIAVLTVEEILIKLEHKRQLKSAKNKRYYETHITYFRDFYQNDRERVCARATERSIRIYHENKAAKAASALPTPPDL